MKTTKPRKSSKITVSVWRPVWSKLEKSLESACLNRDAYISSLVDRELDHLQDEMPIANSEEAERFINKQLRALINHDATPLSIALSPAVAAKLNSICAAKRIVRDSFFNRLFLFLAFGPRLTGMLLFNLLWTDEKAKPEQWTKFVWSECKHDGPFFENVFEPFNAHQDPLWPVRACFELIEEQDKPEYVDWADPASGKIVKMAKWVPENVLHLPQRFYTVPLTDHALRKSTGASNAHPAVRNRPNKPSPEAAYHNLYGLNCYLPNFMVPGHADKKAADDFLVDL